MSNCFEILKNEIDLKKDECCIVLDLGCYFPYSNSSVLTFDFAIGMENLNDYKINNRYPNKGYRTISRTYGRKISKLGYPYIMNLNDQSSILLCLNVGIRDNYITLVFPIYTKMTKDKPICNLKLRYNLDKNDFYFISYEKAKGLGYYKHIWSNCKSSNNDNEIILNNPNILDDNTLVYSDTITPYALATQDFLL